MEKFAFEKFIEDNKIDIQTLPPNLQKRIRGFEELKEDYEYSVEEDKENIESVINKLAIELEEDLYEFYEDHLENNDYVEETVIPKRERKIPKPEKKEMTDEDILEEICNKGQLRISKEALQKLGIKKEINAHSILIGKYRLKKETFSYIYHLSKVK